MPHAATAVTEVGITYPSPDVVLAAPLDIMKYTGKNMQHTDKFKYA
jgi:hypothetical protein